MRTKKVSVTKIKEIVRDRDGFKCVDCGMTQDEHVEACGSKLHVHRHVRGSKYSLEACVTLCGDCHWERHRKAKDLPGRRQPAGSVPINPLLRLSPELWERLAKVGAKFDRLPTQEGRRAIRLYLEEMEAKENNPDAGA